MPHDIDSESGDSALVIRLGMDGSTKSGMQLPTDSVLLSIAG